MNLTRLTSLVGEEVVEKIKKLNILVLGLGGVGGYVVESLVRLGIEKITLVDGDTIKESNLNRQIISTSKNINKYKTKEFKKRIKKINPKVLVTIINTFINEENLYLLFGDNYNYIIDACDKSLIKSSLAHECIKKDVKIISCMGTANRIDGTKLIITTLDNTFNDPLAKRIRRDLTEEEMQKITVITSTETPKKQIELGSTSYVPAIAGLLVTNSILNDMLKR